MKRKKNYLIDKFGKCIKKDDVAVLNSESDKHHSMNIPLPVYSIMSGCQNQLTSPMINNNFFEHEKQISHFNIRFIFFLSLNYYNNK